jgi:tRNA(Ile)-lysidine synthase
MRHSEAAVRHLDHALRSHRVSGQEVCIALSGGVDSVALLTAFKALAADHGLTLTALHVNHGLSPRAVEWEDFCARVCARHDVPLAVERVGVALDAGLGVEAAAREARYRAFARQTAAVIALANHLDDQVETFLIQLLRGAGPKGLAAMPELRRPWPAGPAMLRPWLQLARSDIETYARSRGLEWIEDESNEDPGLDRNFLRHRVLPVLATRYPAYRGTIARSVRNLADLSTLADLVAVEDRESAACGSGIRIDALRGMAPPRALNLLRHLYLQAGAVPPRRAALEEALRQCVEARPDAQVCVDTGAVSLRRYRGGVYLVPAVELPQAWQLQWRGERWLSLPPGLGGLRFVPGRGEGPCAARLSGSPVVVRFRRGGERMALAANRPHRDLRHLYQDAGIPPWVRERSPLVFSGDRLAFVPGLGPAAEFRAEPGAATIDIVWEQWGAQDAAC